MTTPPDAGEQADGVDPATSPPAPPVEDLLRTATRVLLGSAGLAVASARRWQSGTDAADGAAAGGAGTLASAALGLGLQAERLFVRSAVGAGSAAASVTWGVVHATPLRGPVERLAERFRSEQRLSEEEVSAAVSAILEAVGGSVVDRVDLDRVFDRIALERVLARVDRNEIARRIADAMDVSSGA